MADCSGRFDDKLKAITEEAQEALANLEATLKGGGVKKKGTKRRVDILYDSSGKRLIKTPRRASQSTPPGSTSSQSTSNGDFQFLFLML